VSTWNDHGLKEHTDARPETSRESRFIQMHLPINDSETFSPMKYFKSSDPPSIIKSRLRGDPVTNVFRSDFFAGLGWMVKRKIYENEWKGNWPEAYWDDKLRLFFN